MEKVNATLQRDYSKAIDLHVEASNKFEEAKVLTVNEEAQRTLDILAKQHLARSKFLSEQKNSIAMSEEKGSRGTTRPAQSDDLAGSLASARGIPESKRNQVNRQSSGGSTTSTPSKRGTDDDPIYKFYSTVNAVYSKSYQSALSKEETSSREQSSKYPIGSMSSAGTSESFYVVPNTSSLTYEELITENASLRQLINKTSIQLQAHEIASRKQKDAIKNGLIQLKNELTAKENARNKEHDAELEKLKGENDKLKIQIGRLKSRWDELKESARKRREDESTTEDT
ncbi:hypothetical protein TRICI_004722 [Trichomonascus ciferrii]|uniref:Uncharacterized protein n=1 Tax=Trichomonascus ciferrii TaxID=44093 RepID=A0A642V060_9ASCO|nr:hypothetical protein TRICI_004722 [Trichomonascus ciferrii]